MRNRHLSLLLLLVFCLVPAVAGTITYQTVGVYGSDVPETTLSAPDEAFQLIFTLTTPVLALPGSLPGGFSAIPDSASILFRGTEIALIPSYLEFFAADQGGGYVFDGSDGVTPFELSTIADQIFSGDPAAPLLLPGPFPVVVQDQSSYLAILGGDSSGFYTLASATILTPEPGTILLAGLGLAAALLGRKRLRPETRVNR